MFKNKNIRIEDIYKFLTFVIKMARTLPFVNQIEKILVTSSFKSTWLSLCIKALF